MLSVENKAFIPSVIMLNVIMLSVENKPFIQSVIMLNVIMLSVVMLKVEAPLVVNLHIIGQYRFCSITITILGIFVETSKACNLYSQILD